MSKLLTNPAPEQITELMLKGYRRTSNKHGLVSRIDRPDWVEHLAAHLRRAPADLYIRDQDSKGRVTMGDTVSANWCDYYRRVLSKDTICIDPPHIAREVPGSSWDETGYVP